MDEISVIDLNVVTRVYKRMAGLRAGRDISQEAEPIAELGISGAAATLHCCDGGLRQRTFLARAIRDLVARGSLGPACLRKVICKAEENDGAEAIAKAAVRPNRRFVEVMSQGSTGTNLQIRALEALPPGTA